MQIDNEYLFQYRFQFTFHWFESHAEKFSFMEMETKLRDLYVGFLMVLTRNILLLF